MKTLDQFEGSSSWAEAPLLIFVAKGERLELWRRWCSVVPAARETTPYMLVEGTGRLEKTEGVERGS